MIRRRKALKNIGLLTGGILSLPYACDIIPDISYSNLPLIKRDQQELIATICNILLPKNLESFSTPETREHFVLTMINDCLKIEEIVKFSSGLKKFQIEISKTKEMYFQDLSFEKKNSFVVNYIDKEKSEIGLFLNHLKHYSLLHFETSENYMVNYLKYEFMPGRYIGNILVNN